MALFKKATLVITEEDMRQVVSEYLDKRTISSGNVVTEVKANGIGGFVVEIRAMSAPNDDHD